jgi:hypothetical protein
MFDKKALNVSVSAKHMHWFELQENILLELTATSDETWVHYFVLESMQSSMECHNKGSPPPNNFETHVSAGKVIVCSGIQKE